jgi:CheY-like chemotaxis protein
MNRSTTHVMIPSTTAETILVVDDCKPLCELIEVILCSAGYRVLTAENGNEALRLARQTPEIDLLLSDIEMPQMRGDELASRFAALHPSAPVVFVSSATTPIEAAVPFTFVPKPFTTADLRATVRRALHTRPALAALAATA